VPESTSHNAHNPEDYASDAHEPAVVTAPQQERSRHHVTDHVTSTASTQLPTVLLLLFILLAPLNVA
jgi:hypothetical protein